MRFLAIIALLFLLGACAHGNGSSAGTSQAASSEASAVSTSGAANVDGTWSGTYAGGMGGEPMELTFNFKGNGNKLTGTAPGGPGSAIPLKDGKIDGNNISFSYSVDLGGMNMKFNYTGVVRGDEIDLTFKNEMPDAPAGGGFGGPPGGGAGGPAPAQKFTVKRVK